MTLNEDDEVLTTCFDSRILRGSHDTPLQSDHKVYI